MILPVILAGGSGERLWPLSRTAYPKQFLNLFGNEHSLFQNTIHRLPENAKFLAPIVICHADYRFIVAQQLQQINRKASAIILEPIGKNTAPAITLAALWAKEHHPNCKLLILPADHHISDPAALQQTFITAADFAKQNCLITFGVTITRPETGYGYIHADQDHHVQEFIEKPDLARAQSFMHNANYFWNSGMFMFSPEAILQEINTFAPEIHTHCTKALSNATQDLDFLRINLSDYQECMSISIDYAVMEKTQKAFVLPLKSAWSDIGSWHAVWEHADKDKNGNSVSGQVITHNSNNCLVEARYRLVATSNIQDLIIIETSDAVLIAHKDHSQDIRQLVMHLKTQAHDAVIEHRKVMRPWGWYDRLAHGKDFQVKQICVQVGKSLSLQSHKFRSEHWIVVSGNAKVVRDTEILYLNANESTFIPQGIKHQLSNCGTTPLHVIEVQSGTYLGEDDIIRYADEHGRAEQVANV